MPLAALAVFRIGGFRHRPAAAAAFASARLSVACFTLPQRRGVGRLQARRFLGVGEGAFSAATGSGMALVSASVACLPSQPDGAQVSLRPGYACLSGIGQSLLPRPSSRRWRLGLWRRRGFAPLRSFGPAACGRDRALSCFEQRDDLAGHQRQPNRPIEPDRADAADGECHLLRENALRHRHVASPNSAAKGADRSHGVAATQQIVAEPGLQIDQRVQIKRGHAGDGVIAAVPLADEMGNRGR